MKRHLLFLLYSILFLQVHSQVNIEWQQRFSSSGSNSDKAEDMVVDANGNVYVTGMGIGSSGTFDYITIKYNSAGVQQWIAEYNGTGNGLDEAHAIAIDPLGHNVYVTGWSLGDGDTGFDYATIKYNSLGDRLWVSRYTNPSFNGTDEAFDIGVDNAANVYVTGSSDGGLGTSAVATVKYNPTGFILAVKRYAGSGGTNGGKAIYVSPSGNVCVTGYAYLGFISDYNFLTIKYNSSLNQKWAAQYNGPASKYDQATGIAGDAAGNVYVTGYSLMGGLNNYDYTTVKYDSLGNPKWTKNYNGTGNDYDRANAIVLDKAGDIYVTGKSVGAGTQREDAVTLKYDNLGDLKWVARYNGPDNGYDEGKALFVDAAKNVYVAGFSNSTSSGNDYLTLKYDSTGVKQWSANYNGIGNSTDQAAAIYVDNAGLIYMTGYSKGIGSAEDYLTLKYCQFSIDAGVDQLICPGASAALNVLGVGAVSYSWSPAAGLNNPSIANPIATPSVTTTYIVSVTNVSGCVDVDTVVVQVVPLPIPVIIPSGPTTFCSGSSVVLTSGTASFYSWNTSPNDTLPAITVTTSGTYILTIKNSIGCSGSASMDVLVNPLPVVDAGVNASVCYNTPIQLNASGASSYQWSPEKGMNNSTFSNPIVAPLITTIFTVIGVDTNGCKGKDSVKVVVMPSPVINAGADTAVCENTMVQLKASYGYNFYRWHPGKLLNDSTVFNPSLLVRSSTTFTLTATGINGCSNSDSVTINALSLPVIEAGSDRSVCLNTLVPLMPSGGASYAWSPGKILKDSTYSNPTFTALSTTTFTVTGTSSNGCRNMDTIRITVFPSPASPTITARADTVFCPPVYKSYQWYLNSIRIAEAIKPYYKFSINGLYQVIVVDNNGCIANSNDLPIAVGIAENESFADVAVFPNPATTSITLQFDLLKARNVSIAILNSSGQKVYAEELKHVSGRINQLIDIKEYVSGAYYLQLVTDDAIISKKILKQ